jgi:hypothetical protein
VISFKNVSASWTYEHDPKAEAEAENEIKGEAEAKSAGRPPSEEAVNSSVGATSSVPAAISAPAPSSPSPSTATAAIPSHVNLHLTNVSLEVRRGQLVVVVGPVGCSKSTLLMAILGELRPLTGTVSVSAAAAAAAASTAASGAATSGSVGINSAGTVAVGTASDSDRGEGEGGGERHFNAAVTVTGSTSASLSSSVEVEEAIAYCAQEPWIMSMSVRTTSSYLCIIERFPWKSDWSSESKGSALLFPSLCIAASFPCVCDNS